jgi:hypothetical protein
VQSFLYGSFTTGRERHQEAFLFDFIVKSFLHTWFRNGQQQYKDAFLFDYLVKSFFTFGFKLIDNIFIRLPL